MFGYQSGQVFSILWSTRPDTRPNRVLTRYHLFNFSSPSWFIYNTCYTWPSKSPYDKLKSYLEFILSTNIKDIRLQNKFLFICSDVILNPLHQFREVYSWFEKPKIKMGMLPILIWKGSGQKNLLAEKWQAPMKYFPHFPFRSWVVSQPNLAKFVYQLVSANRMFLILRK